jgi:predicted ABC-type transport system involved in lysophospholipase L1 biosynthesis ATPase subunit
MIYAHALTKHFGGGTRPVVALDRLDLQIDAEDRVAILGRSGSGKTTLLNLLAGLDRPTSGQLTVAGHALESLTSAEMASYRRQSIGVIFQSFQLIPQRSAFQNVELPLLLDGVPRSERVRRVRDSLQRVGLSDRATHRPWQLSGGEQQRVAIARAIVGRPSLLLADEPTGNLDSKTADAISSLLLDVIAENKTTLVLITHDPMLAQRCANRVLRMVDGRLCGVDDNVSDAAIEDTSAQEDAVGGER